MDPTPDQVLDALTERYQQQRQAYEHAKADCVARVAELKSTLEQDVERLHNELQGTVEKLDMFGVKMPSEEKTEKESVNMKPLPLSEVYTSDLPIKYWSSCGGVAHIIYVVEGNISNKTIDVPEAATRVFNAQYIPLPRDPSYSVKMILVTGTAAKYSPGHY